MQTKYKVRLALLEKTQVTLLHELQKRGFPTLNKYQLSDYINKTAPTPRAKAVLEASDVILDEWEAQSRMKN